MSVTGEKWLRMLEVKAVDVAGYLTLMKAAGYQIIGLEQTQQSRPLQDFRFAAKTVLLLGNEKRGAPAELLGLLDQAVEIPQFGKVRSLNVHVSAVITIWQFVKQFQLY